MHNDPVGACGVRGGFECSLSVNNVEIDAKLHEVTEEFTKKMYLSMGIPAHLMTIKTGE